MTFGYGDEPLLLAEKGFPNQPTQILGDATGSKPEEELFLSLLLFKQTHTYMHTFTLEKHGYRSLRKSQQSHISFIIILSLVRD